MKTSLGLNYYIILSVRVLKIHIINAELESLYEKKTTAKNSMCLSIVSLKKRRVLLCGSFYNAMQPPLYVRDAVQMYRCMNKLPPSYVSQLFTKTSQTHSFLTRNRDGLQLPKCRTTLAQQPFMFRVATVWNYLSEELQNCLSVSSFKRSGPHV